ncbi:MAG: PA0069 family radical SAM protein, partial [Hyphococcus sp.]
CEHGCIYCFARPTHAYMGLSAGLDFESKLFAKPSAHKLLEKELSDKNYKPRVIAMGTNTDPYQPIERKFQIMRGILSVFAKFNHPVTILTKGQLITRDLDILGPMAAKNLTRAMVSITTQDKALARSVEPRASAPKWRFEAIRRLVDAGVATGIMTGPMIPGLNDDEMEAIMEKAAALGASFSAFTVLRLPLEVSPLFQEWLETYAPNRAKRIMRHIRDMNGGRDYDPHWSRGREIKTPYAQLIAQRNARARARLGFDRERAPLDLSRFRIPAETSGQFDLFV